MTPMRATQGRTLLLVLALTLAAHPAEAQRPGAAAAPGNGPGWAPPSAGFRAGYDYNSRATVVGVQLRIAALPSGYLEIVPTADITFLTGLREYQAGVDAVFVSGGRRGGPYAGGGLAWRNSIYDGPDRETRRSPVAVVGVKTGAPLGGAPFGTQLEMRWIYRDGPFKPRILTLGVNFPLWGRGSRRGR
jgi:hypothetical protein